jgi:LysM repeat protein
MKKMTCVTVAVVVGFAALTLAAPPSWAADRPGFETYVVRSGDTLSKIAGRVFGDVGRWREILKENPQVTNANRIYPGDILQVPLPALATPAGGSPGLTAAAGVAPGDAGAGAGAGGGAGAGSGQGEGAAAGAGSPGAAGAASGSGAQAGSAAATSEAPAVVVPDLPVEQVQSIAPRTNPALYYSAGYIAEAAPQVWIVASQDDRLVLGSGDAAVINDSRPAGTKYKVVRADRRVYHPVTGAYLGWLIQILGFAEVTCRGERTSTVALHGMLDAAGIGDYLVPHNPEEPADSVAIAPRAKPVCVPAGAPDGVIVAFNEDRTAIGEKDLVYIDRGTSSGITLGQRFIIYREAPTAGRIWVGELQVLRAGVRTATALITTSAQEVEVGFALRAR